MADVALNIVVTGKNSKAVLAGIRKELGGLEKQTAKTQKGFGKFSSVIQGIGLGVGVAAFQGLGRAAQGAFRIIEAGFVDSARAAIEFESAFAGVKKTVEATPEEFAKLSDELRQLSKELPLTAVELSGIAEAAGQLGIDKSEIVDFTETMAQLGLTTNLSAGEAATSLARFNNIVSEGRGQFSSLGSAVVSLGNNFATTEQEIVEMGLRLAGAGEQVGLSQAEILGFAATLSSVGINAEAGGTAISKVMIDMAASVSEGGERLAQFAEIAGQSSEDFARAFKEDAAGAIATFIEGLGQIKDSGGDTLGVLAELGIEEVRMRDALLRASSAGDLLRDALTGANDAFRENTALTDEAAKRLATTEAKMQLLKNAITDVQVEIGTALLPAIEAFLDVMLNDIVPVLGDVAKGLGVVVKEIKPMIDAFSQIRGRLKDLSGQFPRVSKHIKQLGKAALLAVPFVGNFVVSLEQLIAKGKDLEKETETLASTVSLVAAPLDEAGNEIDVMGDAARMAAAEVSRLNNVMDDLGRKRLPSLGAAPSGLGAGLTGIIAPVPDPSGITPGLAVSELRTEAAIERAEALEKAADETERLGQNLEVVDRLAGTVAGEIRNSVSAIGAAINGTGDWADALAGTIGLIGQISGAIGAFTASTAGLTDQQIKQQRADALGVGEGFRTGSVSTGVSEGAQEGAQRGGPIGAIIGAGLGLGAALAGKMHQKKAEEAARVLGERMGVTISVEMAEAMRAESQRLGLGDMGLAALLNIDLIAADAGVSMASMASSVFELMAFTAAGFLPLEEGLEAIGRAFATLAEEAEAGVDGAQAAMIKLIQGARAMGEDIPEIIAAVAEALGEAVAGVGKLGGIQIVTAEDAQSQAVIFASTFWAVVQEQGIISAARAMQESFAEMQDSLRKSGFGEGVAAIFDPIARIMTLTGERTAPIIEGIDGLRQALNGLGDAGFITQGSFEAFGQQAASAMAQLAAEGVDSQTALLAIAPLLGDLQAQAAAYGVALDPATQALIDQAEAAGIAFPTDPLLQVVSLLGQMVELLGGEVPAAMTSASASTESFSNSTEQNFEAAAGAIDNSLGEVAASAQAAGVQVGSTFTAMSSRIVLEGQTAALGLSVITGELRAITGAANNASTAVSQIQGPGSSGPGSSGPGGGDVPGFQTGGVGDFGAGSLAMLHGKEAIVPLEPSAMSAGGVSAVTLNVGGITINGSGLDPDAIAESLAATLERQTLPRLNEAVRGA